MNEIDKAERVQAWKAFLIPASLFVACLFNAAGIYICYTGNSIGVIFIGFGFAIITAGMFAFVTFHNKRRAVGEYKRVSDEPINVAPPRDQEVSRTTSSGIDEPTPVDPIPVFSSQGSVEVR